MRLSANIIVLLLIFFASPAPAEVIFSPGFGPENGRLSGVAIPDNSLEYHIRSDYGDIRGQNLFHSFDTFNLKINETANFLPPIEQSLPIENVISRVNGGEASTIAGTIKSQIPGADFYLLNPYGLIFEETSQLDLQGSFHASTADYLEFADGQRFDAKSNEPVSNFLASNPERFGFLNSNSELWIEEVDWDLGDFNLTLNSKRMVIREANYKSGKTLLNLHATGNSIAIQNPNQPIYSKEKENMAQVDSLILSKEGIFINDIQVETLSSQEGEISIEINSIGKLMLDNSQITARVESSNGIIKINAESIELKNSLIELIDLFSDVSGEISIEAGKLSFINDSFIITRSLSETYSSPIKIITGELALDGTSHISSIDNSDNGGTGGFIQIIAPTMLIGGSISTATTSGQAGSINIETTQLNLGGMISSSSGREGQAGAINIYSDGPISISGMGAIRTDQGKGIDLHMAEFNLQDGGRIEAKASPITIVADDAIRINQAAIVTQSGDSPSEPDIHIKAKQLILSEGGVTGTYTSSSQQAGNIHITTEEKVKLSTSQAITSIASFTNGAGQGGEIQITTPQLQLSGASAGLSSESHAEGDAGAIKLEVDELLMESGAWISTSNYAGGAGGLLEINAETAIELRGQGIENPSVLYSDNRGNGQGGDMDINTSRLRLVGVFDEQGEQTQQSGLIQALASAAGNAGHIKISAEQLEILHGGRILSMATPESSGQGGDVTLIINGNIDINGHAPGRAETTGGIGSSTQGAGDSGDIYLQARDLNIDNWGTIQSQALQGASGKAGDIVLNLDNLQLTGGADIDASNEGQSDQAGGNIQITASGQVLIEGQAYDTSAYTQVVKDGYFGGIYSNTLAPGKGGDIHIEADNILLQAGGTLSTGSKGAGSGEAGRLTIQVNEGALTMDNAALLSRAEDAGGGEINIEIQNPQVLSYLKNSEISSQAGGKQEGDWGGNIFIRNGQFLILENTDIIARANAGHGGNISIDNGVLVASGDSVLDASSKKSVDGQIIINSRVYQHTPNTLPDLTPGAAELDDQCAPGRSGSRFKLRGRGGMPDNPERLRGNGYIKRCLEENCNVENRP